MVTTITFVKMQPGLDRASFYERWCEHTGDWDLRDHPEISLNRLMLFEEGSEFVGMAENHWPDRASLEAAIRWYETPEGQERKRNRPPRRCHPDQQRGGRMDERRFVGPRGTRGPGPGTRVDAWGRKTDRLCRS